MNLSIISSTDRPNSWSLKLSNYISRLYAERNVKAKVVSLEDFPLADVVGGKYGKEITSIKKFREPILEADGIIFVIPEYNGGFPGILKMFIDYLPFPGAFEKMPMAFVGEASGAFGALRPVEQFQMIANYRNALQFPERVFIPRVSKEFDPETGLVDDFKQKLLDSQVENFIKFVRDNS
ncbi:MAG TPA: NADPH-dependent oxidoreductase [Balneola sp.]|jgi:chromate reductase, NAD(P)H dehydrogenase (quinone)|nr:NADPH-dependent oxidoreductase [Bacteroidota bacterium]MAC06885.1 NADPH-dependent oxidoreductase [Balneola sp.]MAO77081.1 NADPH-dependent oxidoreductase [Balneola sp.]MBF64648.1 NADPH-dependent oxidoreductase [Balneola sp.]MBF65900.1 NADPH-dependent oxidoreductase [Balneola sp.]|tara:strand:+ start:35432 stop:35971 length:540 start_codon:yes stop_codon:yes gene_type:complete